MLPIAISLLRVASSSLPTRPGHEQYTRNMATGASTAELAIILVDARKGVLRQTRRHTLIASLMGIRQMIVAVNKMDLVDFDEKHFPCHSRPVPSISRSHSMAIDLHFVPLSALDGDNVIQPSDRMPWYQGQSLLQLLETLPGYRPRATARCASRSRLSSVPIRTFAVMPDRLVRASFGRDRK